MIDKNAIHKVADILGPEDFYSPTNAQIYRAILDLHFKNQPVDVSTVATYLKEKGTLKNLGGSSYLADLTNLVATSGNADHYGRIVQQKKTLRDLIQIAGEISENSFGKVEDVEELLDEVEQKIMKVSQRTISKTFISLKEDLKIAFERMERLSSQGDGLRGVGTGFKQMDHYLSGLQKSDLVILGARPSLGKTSLALDIMRNAALIHNVPVGLFSLEMSRDQVVDRIISAEAKVPLWKIRAGKIHEDIEFQMIQQTLDKLVGAPIFIEDTPSMNILQMRSMARRLQLEHGLGLIIVDYLQLITPRGNTDNVVQQVTEISRGLKALARELEVPVLALSQLSRDVDKRDFRAPKLSDLRDSGSIEQDADVVMFISRKDRSGMDITPEEQDVAQISIAKHRNGPIGVFNLKFDQEYASFCEVDEHHEKAPDFF